MSQELKNIGLFVSLIAIVFIATTMLWAMLVGLSGNLFVFADVYDIILLFSLLLGGVTAGSEIGKRRAKNGSTSKLDVIVSIIIAISIVTFIFWDNNIK